MKTDFAESLRRARTQAGLTQDALAEKAGLSSKTISFWERGESIPRPGKLRKLMSAIDLTSKDKPVSRPVRNGARQPEPEPAPIMAEAVTTEASRPLPACQLCGQIMSAQIVELVIARLLKGAPR